MKNLARVSLCALAVSLFGGITVDAQNITTVAGGGPPATGTTVTPTVCERRRSGSCSPRLLGQHLYPGQRLRSRLQSGRHRTPDALCW